MGCINDCMVISNLVISARPRLKSRVPRIFLEPTENLVSARPALLEAGYLEALMYIF